jgi:hypothetical protein
MIQPRRTATPLLLAGLILGLMAGCESTHQQPAKAAQKSTPQTKKPQVAKKDPVAHPPEETRAEPKRPEETKAEPKLPEEPKAEPKQPEATIEPKRPAEKPTDPPVEAAEPPVEKKKPAKPKRPEAKPLPVGELAKLPLLKKEHLQYVGGFRLPGGMHGASSFDYGGTALAYNPVNDSLFLVGHDWHQAIGEVSIPEKLVNSKSAKDLPVATCLQSLTDVRSRIPNNKLKGATKVGGLLVADGKLIGSLYVFYDTDFVKPSHFDLGSPDLSKASVRGLFEVGSQGAGVVAGYMAPIPGEWRSALGAPYLTGQATVPIVGRTSSGPAAFGFDPAKLGSGKTPATPYVYYPLSKPLGKMEAKNALFNGTSSIRGVAFLPGTRSVLFFGSHGTGEITYGEGDAANDKARPEKTYHSRNGEYQYQVWAYDANDFVAAKAKKKQPWQVKPYGVWKLDFPISGGRTYIGGVTIDPNTDRLYVSQMQADEWGLPLIHAFEIKAKR